MPELNFILSIAKEESQY